MPSESLVRALKPLKLHGMAQAADELPRQGAPAFSSIEPMLNTLIGAEVTERGVRSINYQMRAARFPAYRDLSGFDFNESTVDEALLSSLHRCDFVADAHNSVMIGGPGTGKTHLATAIGVLEVQGDIAESKALYQHDAALGGSSRWVDGLRASVPPLITYAFFILFAAVKGPGLYLLTVVEGLLIAEALPRIWDAETQALFAAVMSFWFGNRTLSKLRERR